MHPVSFVFNCFFSVFEGVADQVHSKQIVCSSKKSWMNIKIAENLFLRATWWSKPRGFCWCVVFFRSTPPSPKKREGKPLLSTCVGQESCKWTAVFRWSIRTIYIHLNLIILLIIIIKTNYIKTSSKASLKKNKSKGNIWRHFYCVKRFWESPIQEKSPVIRWKDIHRSE